MTAMSIETPTLHVITFWNLVHLFRSNVGATGGSGSLASATINSSESSLMPTEFSAVVLIL